MFNDRRANRYCPEALADFDVVSESAGLYEYQVRKQKFIRFFVDKNILGSTLFACRFARTAPHECHCALGGRWQVAVSMLALHMPLVCDSRCGKARAVWYLLQTATPVSVWTVLFETMKFTIL